jgi:hypothetical protein
MSYKNFMLLTAVAVAGWIHPGGAHATSLTSLTIEQMTDAADLIAHGVVTEVWVEKDDAGNLWTRANVEITRTLKGDAAIDAVTIDQLGGILQDEFQLISSVPRFSQGEEGLFFLETLGSGRISVVGWEQGKYTARIDPDNGERMAVQFPLPYTRAYDHRFLPHPAPQDRIYMADLEDRILDRLELGWDGQYIPGADPAKLARINKLQPGVSK